MRFEQYSNVIQLAAALSLAGWVARTPDPQFVTNISYNNVQDTRFHPYNNFYGGQQQFEPLDPMVQQQSFPSYPENNYNLYQSKEAEDNFRSFMELQELISWQEAYRRGDLQFGDGGGGQQYVMPIVNKENAGESLQQNSTESSSFDDGYGSSGLSVGSPASSVLSNNFDDLSTIYSPTANSVFDLNEVDDINLLEGASGYSLINARNNEFNIDDLIDNHFPDFPKETGCNENNCDSYNMIKTPFSNLKGFDEDLEYVNSPLKSPSFDEFLASPNPGSYNPNNPALHNSHEDPFQMRFTNSSIADNKFISDTLLELGDFDPSIFENTLANDEEIDKALVESLSSKNAKYTPTSDLLQKTTLKKKLHNNLRHVLDHDYQKQFKQEADFNKISQKTAATLSDLISASQRQTGAVPRTSYQRTFASHKKSTQTKTKQQERKRNLLWPDFPYTSNELVSMHVETFNEIVASLSEIRQHVAKDIRRKGKNKLAARDCRKRKVNAIESLDAGVVSLEQQRINLLEEHQKLIEETQQIRKGTEWLNNYIFEHLRDADGSRYSSLDYSLQYTSDGNVYLVPGQTSQVKKTHKVNSMQLEI